MRLTVAHSIPLVIVLGTFFSAGCSGTSDSEDDDDTTRLSSQEQEPDDQPSQAMPLALGESFIGTLDPGDSFDKDYFKFQIPVSYAGYKVTLSAVDAGGDCFVGVDPDITVLAADGVTQLYWKEDSVEDYCPTLSFVPSPGSTYYAVVSTLSPLTGYYTLTLAAGGTGTVSGTLSSAETARGTAETDLSSPLASAGSGSVSAPGGGAARKADATSPDSGAAVPGFSSRASFMEGELLIQLSPRLSPRELGPRLSGLLGLEARVLQPIMGGHYQRVRVTLPAGLKAQERRTKTLELVDRARAVAGVLSVQPNRLLNALVTPNDPGFTNQWDFQPYPGMNTAQGWDTYEGSSSVVVAVIDTGADPTHPDLKGKAAPGFDFISDADNAGDGDGIDANPDDNLQIGHGTHVAGTVAAATNNGLGVAGVGWNTRFMPLRVCGDFGCVETDILEAIWYAAGFETGAGAGQATRRADVINMSIGGADLCDQALQAGVSGASQRGVIVVVAAGNDDADAALSSPANCDDVLTVGASDEAGRRASFSNYGKSIDVMAPGVNIYSTWYGGKYAYLNGTSMASPHIAGLAALLKGINPTFTFDTVLNLMTSHGQAVDCGSEAPAGCGAGMVDTSAILLDAESRPNDATQPVILVRAVDTADSSRVFTTISVDGAFFIDNIPPGTYRIDAGIDANGDFVPDQGGSPYGKSASTFTVTANGEDESGVHVVLSP